MARGLRWGKNSPNRKHNEKAFRKSLEMKIQISPSRCAAFDVLLEVETKKSRSDALLAHFGENLTTQDRGLCHELVLGVLRRKLYLDRVISQLAKGSAEKFDQEILIALRIGLYQLLYLERIPAYSAINDSVNLVKRAKKTSAANLVNAILRRASREKKFSFEFIDEIERVSILQSHPRWLIERWTNQFGLAEVEKIALANNLASQATFRFTRKSSADLIERLKESGAEFAEGEFVSGCFRVSKRSDLLEEFARQGEIFFQEEASQLVGNLVGLKSTENFLDVCASPGGKTTLISKLADKSSGDAVADSIRIAGDLSGRRVKLLKEICLKLGEKSLDIVAHDATRSLPYRDGSFDVVLLDAPCSGTGTIRRNLEIRYNLNEKDFGEFQLKQIRMLGNIARLVRKGGRIIYSTCSLERDEDEEVIAAFLKAYDGFRKSSFEELPQLVTDEGFFRTFPQRDGIDGFFVANLCRNISE